MIFPGIDTLFSALFLKIFRSEFLIQSLISRLSSAQKSNIYISKYKFGCRQPQTNQILTIEAVAIVSWLIKHFAFFYSLGI